MLNLHRIIRGLFEIGARVAVDKLAEMRVRNLRDIENHVVEQLSVQLSRAIFEHKIKKTIETVKEFGYSATLHRVYFWVLSDEDLDRVANESYLQGVMDGRSEADLFGKRRGEEGLGVSSSVAELSAEHTEAPEAKQP